MRMGFYALQNIPMTFGLLSLQAAMNVAMGWERNGFVTLTFLFGSLMATAGSEMFKDGLPAFETLIAAGSIQALAISAILNGGLIWFYRSIPLSSSLCDQELAPIATVKAHDIIRDGRPQLWLQVFQNCADISIRTLPIANLPV